MRLNQILTVVIAMLLTVAVLGQSAKPTAGDQAKAAPPKSESVQAKEAGKAKEITAADIRKRAAQPSTDDVKQLTVQIEKLFDEIDGKPSDADASDVKGDASPKVKVDVRQAAPSEQLKVKTGQSAKGPANIRFQFDGIPYKDVIRRFAQMANRPLIAEAEMPGSLTFFDAQPYTYDEALDTLNILLSMRGYMLVESNRFLRLVKVDQVQQMPIRILQGSEKASPKPRPGEVVTMVLPLNMVEAEAVAKAVQPMVSSGYGSVSALPNGKSIVVTDRASNIKRIRLLLSVIDVNSFVTSQLWTYQVQNSKAIDIVNTVKALYSGQSSSSSQPTPDLRRMSSRDRERYLRERSARLKKQAASNTNLTITADQRTNTILLVADDVTIQLVEALIKKLDVSQTVSSSELRLIELSNTKATQLAQSLTPTIEALRKTSQADINVAAYPQTNQIIISAPAIQLEKIEQMVRQLDKQVQTLSATRIYQLKHARASELLNVVRSTFSENSSTPRQYSSRDWRSRSSSRSTPTSTSDSLVLTADDRLNALIAKGDSGTLQSIATLVEMLDIPADESANTIHLIHVESADVQQLANNLTQTLGRDSDVTVMADTGSKTLLIKAPQAKREMIEKTIKELDKSSRKVDREIRIISLKNASAASVANVLANFFKGSATTSSSRNRSSRYSRSPQTSSADPVPIITAAPGDKMLVVEATKEQLTQIEQLIPMLDQSDNANAISVRTYRLTKANASELSQSLTQLFGTTSRDRRGASTGGAKFQIDSTTNQLIVAASLDQFEQIEKVIKQVETAPVVVTQTRTFRLNHAKAEEVATILTEMLTGTSSSSSRSRSWGGRESWRGRPSTPTTTTPVRVAAMTATNDVVVQGDSQTLALAEQLIKTFDTPEAATSITMQVVKLKNAQAVSLAEALNGVLAERAQRSSSRGGRPPSGSSTESVPVTAENNSNSLLVRGKATEVAKVVTMIGKLDQQSDNAGLQVRIYPLTNASAEDLAISLDRMFKDLARQNRSSSRSRSAQPKVVFTVASDSRTNSLVVSTTNANFALVEQLLDELDKTPDRPSMDVRYIWLENADAFDVQMQLASLFENRKSADQPVIEADMYANTLTVIAKSEDLSEIETIVTKLDEAASDNTRVVRVITMDKMRAEKVAQMVRNIYPQLSDTPVIVNDNQEPATIKTPENQPKPQSAPQPRSDASSTPAKNGTEIKASDSTKVDAALPSNQSLNNKAASPENEHASTEPGELNLTNINEEEKPTVTVGVDRQANALIVSGTRKQLDEIDILIADLQLSTSTDEDEIRVYKIVSGDPTTIAMTLDKIFNVRQQVPVPQRSSSRQSQNDRNSRGGQDSRSQPQRTQTRTQVVQNIAVVAEPRTSSVIVRGKTMHLDMVEQLIKQIDVLSTIVNEVRVFTLKNTNASEVASNLQQVISGSPAPSGRSSQQGRSPQASRSTSIKQMLQLRYGGTTSQINPGDMIGLTANTQTNSIVVTAPAEVMPIVQALIEELDQSAALAQIPSIRMYPVKDAEVASTVQVLNDIFGGGSSSRRPQSSSRGGQRSTSSSSGGEIRITSDEAGRLIIVSAPAEKQELIATVIKDLDQAQSADKSSIRVYHVDYADATEVAKALTQTMQGPSKTKNAALRISADRSSNALVVRGDEQEHERIAQLISEIDTSPALKLPVQLILLKNADPMNLATILNKAFGDASLSSRNRSSSRSGGGSGDAVLIEADAESHMLMVRAKSDTFTQIKQMAEQLDKATDSASSSVYILALKNGDAASVAAMVMDLYKQEQQLAQRNKKRIESLAVSADLRANALVLATSKTMYDKVNTWVQQIETMQPEQGISRIVTLQYADPIEVEQAIQQLFGAVSTSQPTYGSSARGSSNRNPGPTSRGGTSGRSSATNRGGSTNRGNISSRGGTSRPSATSNRGGSTNRNSATNRGGSTNRGSATNRGGATNRSGATNRGGATNRSAPTNRGGTNRNSGNRGSSRGSRVSNESSINILLAASQAENNYPENHVIFAANEAPADSQAIAQQSTPQQPAIATKVATKKNNEPTIITGSSGPVETAVLPQQRAILINANDADFAAIDALIKLLDKKAEQARPETRVVKLQHATNTRISTALTELYRSIKSSTGVEETIIFTPIMQSEVILVTAPKERMNEVLQMIGQLDTEQVSAKVDFKVYKLKHVMPTKIIGALQQMISPLQQDRPDEPINLQADERTRSIIVTARPGVFDQISKIIETLDTVPAFATAEVMIYPLKNADATRLAEVLNDMLRPSDTGQVTDEARLLQEQINRLRLRTKQGKQLSELDLTKPIKVMADPVQFRQQGSNQLIITSTPDNLKAMAAIIEVMDIVPLADGAIVKLIHLKNADGESIVETLREVFEQALDNITGKQDSSVAGRAEPDTASGKALVKAFNVSFDGRTNTLVLSGSKESVALAELIVEDLDREHGKFVTEVKLFKLKHADAEKLQPLLSAVFAQTNATPGTEGLQTQVTRMQTKIEKFKPKTTDIAKTRAALTIQADANTQTLIVAARSDVMPLIEDVIKTLDFPSAGASNSVRVFPLINADATRLKQVIDDLYTGDNASLIRDEDKPTISTDTRTNALVIAANVKTYKMIGKLLKQLDAKQPIDFHDVRLVALKNATADELANTLQTMMDARVQRQESLGVKDAESLRMTIISDPRSNSLIIGGSKEGFDLVESLAKQLDGASPALAGQIQIFPLKSANAGTLSTSLTNLFNQRYEAAISEDVKRQKPVILGDLRTNSLLVSATPDDSKVLKSLLDKLDKDPTDPAIQLTVVALKHNDAGIVAPTITEIFDARLTSMTPQGEQPSPQDQVGVVADSLANALIISASKENMKLIQGLLEKVDVKPPMDSGVVRVYSLKNADATQVSTMLRDLVTQGIYKPGRLAAADDPTLQAMEQVSITTDLRTNALIISASKENFAVIEQIVMGIDKIEKGKDIGSVKSYYLKHADATRTATTLQQLFDAKQQAEQQLGEGTRSMAVSVTADTRTNTLLVSGDKQAFTTIESLLKRIDTDSSTKVTEIRVFPLQYSNADELAQLLNDTLNEKPDPLNEENPNRQTLLQFITQLPGGDKLVTTAIQQSLLINPDVRSNSLIVSCPVENLPLLAQLIKSLDDANPRVAEIRVFSLTNADATQMADVLSQLFKLEGQTTDDEKTIRYTLVDATSKSGDNSSAVLGSAEKDALTVTVDVRTNSLLVGGTKHYVKLVSDVITKLDSSPAQERKTKLYRLRHAQSADIQTALRDFLDQERDRLEQALGQEGLGAAMRLLEHEVAIVSEDQTNTLLLSASPRYFGTIEGMIKQLDQPPPQVMIECQIIQLNLSNEADMGIQWEYNTSIGSSDLGVGTDFGLAQAAQQFGGFSLAVTGGDLTFFLRALEAKGNARILSRPQVMAVDNQEGVINVGQSVPIITSSQITDNDRVINTIEYRDIGINLTVTPRINDDGMVSIQVEPEISALSESNIEVNEGVVAPIIDQIRVTTTVSVQDGQSILIGGLIRAEDSVREKKVPLLGDIPLIGFMFRSTERKLERREILIILTPRILRNVKDGDLMTKEILEISPAYRKVIDDEIERKLYEKLKDVRRDPLEDIELDSDKDNGEGKDKGESKDKGEVKDEVKIETINL